MSTQLDATAITYDRISKDYTITDAGEYIGSAPNYSAAEQLRTAYLASRTHSRVAEPAPEVVEVKALDRRADQLTKAAEEYKRLIAEDRDEEARALTIDGHPIHVVISHGVMAISVAPLTELDDLDTTTPTCFPDEPIGDCVLDGKPAWSLDETLTSPLCPDHKAEERTWIANRDGGNSPGGSGGGGGNLPRLLAHLETLPSAPAKSIYEAAGSVWAPGPPPPPEPPSAPPTPAPTPASALLPLIKLLLDAWAEEPRPTPYDAPLAALARAIAPPPLCPVCAVCGGGHRATQCPEVTAERERQEMLTQLGCAVSHSYRERRDTLAEVLRDSDTAERQKLADALRCYLLDQTGVAVPPAMVYAHFDRLAA